MGEIDDSTGRVEESGDMYFSSKARDCNAQKHIGIKDDGFDFVVLRRLCDILSVRGTKERPDAVGWAGWIASVYGVRL